MHTSIIQRKQKLELILERNTMLLTKKHQAAVHVTISKEGMRKMRHKQQNLILTSLQFRKNYQCPLRLLAVRYSDTLLA